MKILALESSAAAASAAILEDETILAEAYCNAGLTHSQTLAPMAAQVLALSRVSLGEIDGFAVTTGPGSFTGVRIGVSATKGLAFDTQKPCVAVSTLEAIAEPFRDQDVTVCAVMDARCNQFYQSFFCCGGGMVRRQTEDRAIGLDQLKAEIEQKNAPVLLAGDGAALAYRLLGLPGCSVAPPGLRYQRASSAGLVALRRYRNGNFVLAEQLTPVYLRPPQAERELAKKKKNQ